MNRQAHGQQAEAAAVLHSALVCLNRGGACREPLTPGMFARPNLKGLQAVLHLLHLRIRGTARTKKELQHIYPVLEPAQAREFKAAMHAWIHELGAAGAVAADTVKYFASAYQGGSSHRTVLMLLDLCCVALSKELGARGPHATLPGIDELQLGTAVTSDTGGTQAAAALRAARDRLDAVVAAMQRLKQLHTQAAGQLAAGQAASGSAALALTPRLPPLFAASQASIRRGEIVQQLLGNGPLLTSTPEAVGPDSWADLLAAGRAVSAAPSSAQPASPLLARRLSNPVQEASNFAAEGLAADADVLAVLGVLARRLAAAASSLQTASSAAGAALGAPGVMSALAEAAACREALMLGVRQELSAAKLREEQQAHSGVRPALLQLLPPSRPHCNPVLEGLQAAQTAAGAAAEPPAGGASGSCGGWEPLDTAAPQALRQSIWQRARQGSSGLCSSEPASPAAAEQCAGRRAAAPAGRELEQQACSPEAQQLQQQEQGHCRHGSSSSKLRGMEARAGAPHALASPTLADVVDPGSRGLALAGLLSEESLEGLPDSAAALGSPKGIERQRHHQQHQQHEEQLSRPYQPQQQDMQAFGSPGSPCMAESCASFSVMAENHSSGSMAGVPAASSKQQSGHSWPLPLAASPMTSAAASFVPPRPLRYEQQRWQGSMQRQPSSSTLSQLAPAPVRPTAAVDSSARKLLHSSRLHAASAVVRLEHPDSDGTDAAGTPGLAPGTADSGRLRAASVAFTLTPPRRLGDSPLSQPAADGSHEATPISQIRRPAGSDGDEASKPLAGGAVLQPLQPGPLQNGQDSPALLASCFKSEAGGLDLGLSPLASPMAEPARCSSRFAASQQPPQVRLNPPRWSLAAAAAAAAGQTAFDSLDSPQSSGSSRARRRSALHTTTSPACREAGGTPRDRSLRALAAASPLVTPPRSLLATPDGPMRTSHLSCRHGEPSAASSQPAAGSTSNGMEGASAVEALRQRMARAGLGLPNYR
ncbi:hypothetical protein ABPG77_009382 [Micractinium sp. CCAP 211/92]